MEPIRILHEDVIMDQGGIESLLMNVYRHIDRDKVQFDFMMHRSQRAFYEDEILSLGGRIYRTPKFSPFPGEYQKFMESIEKILRNHPEYKIFHAHADLNLWPLMVATKLGIPTRIAHSHNAESNINLKHFFFIYQKLFIKNYCTDMFMCSTPAGEWSFGKKAVKTGKVKFIKNGIETERFEYNEKIRYATRMELGVGDKLVIGHVGRFMKQKNHGFLLDIFAEIHKRNINSVLLLIGDGQLIEEYKVKAERRGISDDVKFLGIRSDVNCLMQAMDVFLFPSLWEGLPLTGIEAQTSGLPVIMSDVITDEVCITRNVYKMSLEKSPADWADKALHISEKFERRDMRQKIIESGFDIHTTAQILQDFYISAENNTKFR